MKYKFIEKEICYTGKELAPNWAYKAQGLLGDSIVSFIGKCDVKLDEMVDIEDVLSDSPIYSKKMLSFIIEHFNMTLIEGVVRQRFLISIIEEALLRKGVNPTLLCRKGDDLFYNNGKLSVSIAAKSINSVLIHIGLNIDSIGTPVKAAGLSTDMNLSDFAGFAEEIMKSYTQECQEILDASCKVKGII